MTNAVAIRRATPADLPALLRLYAQPDIDNGVVLARDEAERVMARMATYPDYGVYVATSAGGQVLGTFALLIMDNLAHRGAPSAVVEDVVVDAAQRSHGIGAAMMRHAMDAARARGCYKLTLSSNLSRERAHEFYRALGFEQHGLSFRVPLTAGADPHRTRGGRER